MPSVYYITAAQFLTYYDVRRVADLLADDGVPVEPGDIPTNENLKEAIAAACGEIDSHCQQGKRYTRETLEAIIEGNTAAPNDVALRKASAVLKQLAADLTFGTLMARRGYSAETMERMAPRLTAAYKTLEDLYQGRRVFDLSTAIEAGRPWRVRIGKDAYQPSLYNRLFGLWPDTAGGLAGLYPRQW